MPPFKTYMSKKKHVLINLTKAFVQSLKTKYLKPFPTYQVHKTEETTLNLTIFLGISFKNVYNIEKNKWFDIQKTAATTTASTTAVTKAAV